MKKKLTCSLLAFSLALNTATTPNITKVFAQDEILENSNENETPSAEDIDAEEQAYLDELAQMEAQMEGDYTYLTFLNGTIVITGYKGSGGAVTIPNNINGRAVTSIDDGAFQFNTSLTSVTIPDSVTSIGDRAFKNCSSLTSVTIPSSVTSIDDDTFNSCTSLTSVTIPDSVTYIGARAFVGCSSLTSVTIPSSVTTISIFSFADCSSLTSVTIPNSVTYIHYDAFFKTDNLTDVYYGGSESDWKAITTGTNNEPLTGATIHYNSTGPEENEDDLETPDEDDYETQLLENGTIEITKYIGSSSIVTIPNKIDGLTVSSIGGGAFYNLDNLTSVTIPNSVTKIGSNAFGGCNILTSVTIPDSVTLIESYAFKDCKKLASVTLPNSITRIAGFAFYNCNSLTSVTIPSNVTEIGEYAFASCDKLTSVTMPSSVTNIVNSAFRYCDNLTDVYYSGNETDWEAITIGTLNESLTEATIHYNSIMPDSGSTPDEDGTETPDSNYETDLPDYDIGDKDAGEADVAEDGHLIVIWDKNNNPVPGATVAINGKNHTAVNGKVSLTSADLGSATTFNVVASGFQPISSKGLTQDKNISYVTMISDSSTELFTTVSFSFENNSLKAPISGSGNMVANIFWEASPITFVANDKMYIEVDIPATVDASKYTYELVKGNTVVQKSNNGVFEFDALNTKAYGYIDVFDINGLSSGDNYSVLITDNTTKNSTLIPTNLSVAEPSAVSLSDLPTSFSFGDKISFGVAGIPIFEGAFKEISDKMNIGLPDSIPFDFEYTDDLASTTLVASVGKDLNKIFSGDINDSGKIAIEEVNKKISELESKSNTDVPKVFGQDINYSLGPVSAGGSVGGIAKIVNNKYKNTWTGIMAASADASLGGSFGSNVILPVPPLAIPITVEFKTTGTMEANGSGELTWGKGVDKMSHELDFSIAPGVVIGGDVGVGIDDFIEVGVTGSASLKHNVNLKTSAALTTLGGNIGIYGILATFDRAELSVLSSEMTIYDSTNRSIYSELMSINNNNNSEFTLMSRDYLNSPATISNNVIKSGVLSSSRPEIINVNGTSYVFWIDDAGTQRNSANRAALYYSQYNNGSWSAPTQVVTETGDSTNDFYFDVTVDNNNKIHITWLKSNNVLSDNVTLDEMFSDFDVYYTTITNNTIATPTKVTSNSNHDNMVSISDDGSTIAWVEYPENSSVMGILTDDVVGTIKYASTSNLNDVKTHASNVNVTSLGVIGNKVVYSANGVVYINGQSVYSGTASSNIKTNNGTAYWIDSDSLSSVTTLYSSTGSSATKVFSGDINSSYSITDAGPVWASYNDGDYYFKGATDSTTSYIMDKIDATEINKTSAYSNGDTFTVAYMDTETNTIKSQNVTKAVSDISLDNIGLESYIDNKNRIVSETTSAIILDVTNHGNSPITTATLKIDGSDVKTFTGLSIAPGESITLKHDYNHGVLSGTKTFNAEITTSNDKFADNNKNTFTLGYSNLGVTTTLSRVNSSHLAEVVVSNDMYTKTGATLNIRSHSQDGDIVFTKSISDISKGTDSISLVNLSAIEKELNSRIDVFFIELIPNGNSDISSGNIYDVITLSSGRVTVDSNQDNDDNTQNDNTTDYTNDALFGANNKISKVTTPNTVTLSAQTANKTDEQVLKDAEVSSPYSANAVLGSFSLSGSEADAYNDGIKVTMDSNSGYSNFAVVHYDDDADNTYKTTYINLSGSTFTFHPQSFSSFYVVGLTGGTSSGTQGSVTPNNSASNSNGNSSNGNVSSGVGFNTHNYSSGSIYIPSVGYISEFRGVIIGELINLDKIKVNDMDIIGWYYDPDYTEQVEDTSMFVVTQDVIDNGLYPKFDTKVSDTLIDGSTNAGFVVENADADTTIAPTPTPVPSTLKKFLAKLF